MVIQKIIITLAMMRGLNALPCIAKVGIFGDECISPTLLPVLEDPDVYYHIPALPYDSKVSCKFLGYIKNGDNYNWGWSDSTAVNDSFIAFTWLRQSGYPTIKCSSSSIDIHFEWSWSYYSPRDKKDNNELATNKISSGINDVATLVA